MLIVEGVDGTGKSTLCQLLLKAGIVDTVLPSPRITAKGDPERMKYETERYIRLHGDNNRVAVDRFLFSEMAYGRVIRGRSVFTKGDYLHKLVELMLKGSIVIFCMPDQCNYKPDESPFLISKMPELKAYYEDMVQQQALTSPYTYIYKWNEDGAFQHLQEFLRTVNGKNS
jgi:hypothetical protein